MTISVNIAIKAFKVQNINREKLLCLIFIPQHAIVRTLYNLFPLKSQVFLPQCIDTINHFLDQLNLGVTQSVLVGDVVSVTCLTTRLSTSSTGLQMKLFASGLQLVNTVLGPSRQVNMDRGPHASSQVGGARVNVSIFSIQTEIFSRLSLDRVTNSLDASGQSLKDSLDISTLLHGDDSELILLIDPDEESLGSVVEDTSAFWPVSFHSSNSQISVSRHEEEMIINKLLPLIGKL